jgi:tRNA U55 pseudouridine synthase TruB
MIIEYNKNIGETMGELINRFRSENNLDKDIKIAFAGRLDPIAYGKVIILTHNDVYKKDEYCSFNKIYQCKIVQGFKTDTFDIMGLVSNIDTSMLYDFNNLYDNVINYSFEQEYPAYSSYKVADINGVKRPLWFCNKNNIKINSVPTKQINLFYGKQIEQYEINYTDLYKLITNKIDSVKSKTFRQDEILEKWKSILLKPNNPDYPDYSDYPDYPDYPDYSDYSNNVIISSWEFKISSGGYIRHLANNMNGSCFDIERIKYMSDEKNINN